MRASQIVAVALYVHLCVACQPAVDVESTEADVRALLDRYVRCVEQEDMEQYAQVVAHDAAMMNFGAFGAPIVGWDGLQGVMEGQNASLEDIEIEQSDVRVHILPGGENAWATSLWQFKASAGEDQLNLPVRCTWQLGRREGTWRVVHFHKSIAAD